MKLATAMLYCTCRSNPTTILTLRQRRKYRQFINTPLVIWCLASYGASQMPLFRKAAQYVDKFSREQASRTPVETAVAFELALNLKTQQRLA